MRKAPKTKRKGYANGTNQNGIEMGWMTYANQARGMAESNVEYEEIVDPKTGQVYRQPKTKEGAIVAATAKPAHETWMEDIKSGNTKQLAADIFLTPAGGNVIRGKGGFEDPEFEKQRQRINQEQGIDDALAARERGETGFTPTETYRKPEQTAKNPFLMGKLENTTKDVYQNPAKTLIPKAFGFNKGGEVQGKGGPKSDSINAEIEEGSFVVPAENAHVGKMIRNMMGKKNGKANLHQKNGVPVKLSNTEVVFSPEEKEAIENELGEDFLKSLAPEAEDHEDMNHEMMEGEGMAKGGDLSAEKAKTMLRDNQANGQPLTDKQKRYFGWIAGGRKMANGGEIPKGTTVLGATWDGKNWRRGATVYSKDGGKAFEEAYQKQASKKDTTKDALNEYGKSFESRHRSDLESEYESLKGKDDDYAKYRRKQIEKEIGVKPVTKSGTELENLPETKATPIVKKTNVKPAPKTNSTNPFVYQELISSIQPNINLAQTETNDALREINNPNTNAVDTNPVSTKPSETKQLDSAGNFWDKASSGNLLNAGLSAFQIGMGLKGLSETKRPTFELDKTFNANVDKAQANAQFGFTPEQKFLIDQSNQNLLNKEIFAAQNFAGGSSSNAYNMTRSALNNAFTRGLETKVADTALQQDKQSIANQTALQRAQMNRMIFEDSLNAFNQKQSSSANLLGAGISNALDANRFAQFMKLRDQENTFKNQYGI